MGSRRWFRRVRGRVRDDGRESFPAGIWRHGGGGEVLGDNQAGPGGRERGPAGRGAGGGSGRPGGAVRRPGGLGGGRGRVPRPRGAGEGDRGRGTGTAAAAAAGHVRHRQRPRAAGRRSHERRRDPARHRGRGSRPGPGQRVRAGPGHPEGLPQPPRAEPVPRRCPAGPARGPVLPGDAVPGGLPPGRRRVRAGPGGHRGPHRRHRRPRPAHRPRGRPRGLDGRLLRRALPRRGRRRAAGQRRDHDAGRRQGHRHAPGAPQERRQGGRHASRDQEDGRDRRRRRLHPRRPRAGGHRRPARRQAHPGPKARDKWVSASVTESIEDMIAAAYDEADRRDPQRVRQRVFLVDGNKQQLSAIEAKANERGLKVPVLIDYIHVSGYIGKAAAALHPGDPVAAGQWADGQLLRVLHGRAKAVAATLASVARKTRENPRKRGLDLTDMDRAVTYLTNNQQHMKYDKALEKGWPIATGMIEGACRFVIEDRFGITGARWSPDGAEVILKLRAVVVNGDLDDYMRYYKKRYRNEHHLARYDEDTIDRLNLAA